MKTREKKDDVPSASDMRPSSSPSQTICKTDNADAKGSARVNLDCQNSTPPIEPIMTIDKEKEAEIRRLAKAEKWPKGTIAKQLGVHHSVVTRVLERPSSTRNATQRKQRDKSIDPFEEFIKKTLEDYPTICASRLHDMICDRGYRGSERTVRRAVTHLRPAPKKQAYLRITPIIAEQMQVDWAFVRNVEVRGGQRKLWLFVALLPYSRGLFAEFVWDLSVDSLRRSLRRAGEFFGGHARSWLFDNAKSVVLQRHQKAAKFNPLLLDACGHYSVQPLLCTPRRANEKGGVERAIRYLRTRFLAARDIVNPQKGNEALLHFIETIAHPRPHPTLPQRTVQDCLIEEKEKLLELPEVPLCTDTLKPAVVDKTAFIRFDTNFYSVPPKTVGRTVTVVADDQQLRVVDGQELLAIHPRLWDKKQVRELRAHRAQLGARKSGARPNKRLDHLRAAAPALDDLLSRWVEAGYNLGSTIARVQKLFELYGPTVFRLAVAAVLEAQTPDVGALAIHCEQLRRKKNQAVPIPLQLSAHVPERDVIPHALEQYDDEA